MLLTTFINIAEGENKMSNLSRWNPFTELSALQKQFFGDDWLASFKGTNIATTDVYTKNNQLVVEVHLPNFEQKDIDIHVEDNALVVSAERHEKEEDKDKAYVVRESSNSFYRRISLPERADTNKIEAHLDNGRLSVTIPLAPLPEPKKIAISSGKK